MIIWWWGNAAQFMCSIYFFMDSTTYGWAFLEKVGFSCRFAFLDHISNAFVSFINGWICENIIVSENVLFLSSNGLCESRWLISVRAIRFLKQMITNKISTNNSARIVNDEIKTQNVTVYTKGLQISFVWFYGFWILQIITQWFYMSG